MAFAARGIRPRGLKLNIQNLIPCCYQKKLLSSRYDLIRIDNTFKLLSLLIGKSIPNFELNSITLSNKLFKAVNNIINFNGAESIGTPRDYLIMWLVNK